LLVLTASLRPVPEQISELKSEHPLAVALSHGGRQLTMAELDVQADRFAGYLQSLGVEHGGTVAICSERSIEWIVAALGIMRAGAAYVPLDTAWPDDRLRYAVNDSRAIALVAHAEVLDRLQVKAKGIDPWRDADLIAAFPAFKAKPIDQESLAYVIYTSGSTGVPKGVEITHANLAHLIRWHWEAFKVTGHDRASYLAGLGFDAAVWEIWPNLTAGATLCIIDDDLRSSPELIQQWMIRERVTIGFVPTVHARPMLALAWPAETKLRLLLTGGDALHHSPPAGLPFEVVNNYGPSECTVVATSCVLKPGTPGVPPIGHAITGGTVYLLDETGAEVTDGSVGEIYIGGSGVGRGYRNLPDITERSFLRDPFASSPDARMYRSGDRGLRRPDGEIEFRGRVDRQAKIRGYRIELDEIASVLAHHLGIEFATATIHTPEGGENQLLAYVLPKENVPVPTVDELQEHLQLSLPGYMVPAIFVRLEAVPVSPNGKIDLAKLPQPTEANRLAKTAGRVAASPIEEKLLAMLRTLLENDSIGPEDNIFLAGGHSLLGMQLVIRLRNTFGVDVTLRQLFEAPTVARLAVFVETKLLEAVDSMSEDEAKALLTEYEDNGNRQR
jgi:amino acid adenylation domain-containing protein